MRRSSRSRSASPSASLIDAFLVRMTLVPAVMALLGDKAWWMPRWLDRVLPRFDIEGEAVERELALADWPEPDTTAVVVAEDLDARGRRPGALQRRQAAPRARRVADRHVRGSARCARPAAHRRRARRTDRRPAARRRAPAARTRARGCARTSASHCCERLRTTRSPSSTARCAVARDRRHRRRRRPRLHALSGPRGRRAARRRHPSTVLVSADRPRPRPRPPHRGRPLRRRRPRPLRTSALPSEVPHDRATACPLAIERARTRRPVTWLTLIGVLLLPVVIGGILVAALYNPVERLDGTERRHRERGRARHHQRPVRAARPAADSRTRRGLGRADSNLTWTISNADDAAEGLADGTYSAVITIPENFSAAATSTQPGETPERATIDVQTPPDSLIVDDAITAQVTTAAASLMGDQLSKVYLENVFLGFTTLGDQLGEAADGATRARRRGAAGGGRRRRAPGRCDAARRRRARHLPRARRRSAAGLDHDRRETREPRRVRATSPPASIRPPQRRCRARSSSPRRPTATYAGRRRPQTAALALSSASPRRRDDELGARAELGGLAAQCWLTGDGSLAFCAQLGRRIAARPRAAAAAPQDAVTAATSAGTASGYAAPHRGRHRPAHDEDERRADRSPRAAPGARVAGSTSSQAGTTSPRRRTAARERCVAARRRRRPARHRRAVASRTASQPLADGHRPARERTADGGRPDPDLHRRRGDEPRRRRVEPGRGGGQLGTCLFGASAIPLLATARAVVRRARDLRGAAGGQPPGAHVARAVGACSRCAASRPPPRSAPLRAFSSRASCSSPRRTTGPSGRCFAGLCDRGRHRVRRREPGARRGVRRRRPLDLGPHRRARRRDGRRLDGARRALERSRRSCRRLPPTTACSRR